jgi:hypothetical protein
MQPTQKPARLISGVPAAARRERPGSAVLMKLPLGREQSGSIRLSRLTRAVTLNLDGGQCRFQRVYKILND